MGWFVSLTWTIVAAYFTALVSTSRTSQGKPQPLGRWVLGIGFGGIAAGALAAMSPMPFALVEAVASTIPGLVALLSGIAVSKLFPRSWSDSTRFGVVFVFAVLMMAATWASIVVAGIELGGIAP
jgi:hypothetical protein